MTERGGVDSLQSGYSSIPPTLAQFSPHESDVIVFTGFGMNKLLQFYSLARKKVQFTPFLPEFDTRCVLCFIALRFVDKFSLIPTSLRFVSQDASCVACLHKKARQATQHLL